MAPPGELPPQTIWGFNGITPGPLFVERYGNLGNPGAGSILVRQRNNLPSNNGGFGLPSVTTTCTTATHRSRATVSPVSLWNEASSTITTIPTSMPASIQRIPARATSRKRCIRCGITTTASITPPRTPTKASPALTFSSMNSTLVTKTPASVCRASATDKTR
jgi:hypothetical protein